MIPRGFIGLFKDDKELFVQGETRNVIAVNISINEQAKAMEHPVEDGSIITDHRVILPIEANLSIIVPGYYFAPIYDQIKELYLKSKLLQIYTRTGRYDNMMIVAMPHKQDADMMDALAIGIKLKEVVIVSSKSTEYKPKKAAQAKTVDKGTVQPKEPKSALSSVVDWFSGKK